MEFLTTSEGFWQRWRKICNFWQLLSRSQQVLRISDTNQKKSTVFGRFRIDSNKTQRWLTIFYEVMDTLVLCAVWGKFSVTIMARCLIPRRRNKLNFPSIFALIPCNLRRNNSHLYYLFYTLSVGLNLYTHMVLRKEIK